jgi:nucleotidyltransferase substrate binding protein (TIGR01987 family)
MSEDIRWKQRYDNFAKAFAELRDIADLAASRPLSRLEKQGAIQCFEYTHELAWNVLKDYLEFQGFAGLIGSRDTTREAFRRGLVQDGDVWMAMIKSRNTTSHAYDQEIANGIYDQILSSFFPAFRELHDSFLPRCTEER